MAKTTKAMKAKVPTTKATKAKVSMKAMEAKVAPTKATKAKVPMKAMKAMKVSKSKSKTEWGFFYLLECAKKAMLYMSRGHGRRPVMEELEFIIKLARRQLWRGHVLV